MTQVELRSLEEFTHHCTRAFTEKGMSREPALLLAEAIADDLTERYTPSPQPGTFALMLPVKRWVIRDDDINLLDSLWTGITAAASVNFFQQSLTVSAATGIVAAVFKAAHRAARKGVSLDPLKCRLLLGLRRSKSGLTVMEATAWLNELAGAELGEDAVRAELQALAKVRLQDGTIAALVAVDHDGRWSTAGV